VLDGGAVLTGTPRAPFCVVGDPAVGADLPYCDQGVEEVGGPVDRQITEVETAEVDVVGVQTRE
jgi:hypothetical protein